VKRRLLTIGFVVTAFSVGGHATQAPSSGAHFETVVIKAADGVQSGGGTRTLPDGTTIMTGARIRQFILLASPVPVRSVAGAPDWVDRQRYDITLKPPAGSSREQRAEMIAQPIRRADETRWPHRRSGTDDVCPDHQHPGQESWTEPEAHDTQLPITRQSTPSWRI